jgi:hypothetical protein
VYEAEDLRRHEQLADSMPVVARAVKWEPEAKPPDEPRLLVRDMVARLVECLVWMGYMTDDVPRRDPPRRHRWRWRSVPIHERWLETLLTPDLELKGKDAEVLELCHQIDAWIDAIFSSRPEYEREETPISLPPKGEDFWVGRQLPVDFLGPVEAPPNPALILSRVGELPGWQGERPLRDSLEPVYEAASRYALEHVFGRKPVPRVRLC